MNAIAPHQGTWAAAAVALTLLAALAFKPWLVLRHRPLQHPWLAAMALLPWSWWSQALLPSGMALHFSGACLLVLMFGWPMAMLMAAMIGLLTALVSVWAAGTLASVLADQATALSWIDAHWEGIASQVLWSGVMPATFALGLGLAMRRWLPRHLFVYILGRGFFTTLAAITLTAIVRVWASHTPPGLQTSDWMLGHWLLAWGEAVATGMLVSIFVAFRP